MPLKIMSKKINAPSKKGMSRPWIAAWAVGYSDWPLTMETPLRVLTGIALFTYSR